MLEGVELGQFIMKTQMGRIFRGMYNGEPVTVKVTRLSGLLFWTMLLGLHCCEQYLHAQCIGEVLVSLTLIRSNLCLAACVQSLAPPDHWLPHYCRFMRQKL